MRTSFESAEMLVANGAIQLASRSVQSIREAKQFADTNADRFRSANASLIDIASKAIVEPPVLVDTTVANMEVSSDILQACLSLFTGYYMQAVSLVSNIDNISVASRLDKFNPNRKAAFEEYSQPGVNRRRLHGVNTLALEEAMYSRSAALEDAVKVDGIKVDSKAVDTVKENVNLSVGKMFMVDITEGERTIRVPVAIRLNVNNMTEDQMRGFFTFRNMFDMDMRERWHGYRAGRLEFWRDLILCNDLIDKYRKGAISDKSGMTSEQLKKEAAHIASSIVPGKPVSLATASTIAVMSTNTLALVENELGGNIESPNIRKNIFDNTNLMFLVIVDAFHEIVTFWHRGISTPTRLTFRDIKNSNKGGGADVNDIMKTFLLGNAPTGR